MEITVWPSKNNWNLFGKIWREYKYLLRRDVIVSVMYWFMFVGVIVIDDDRVYTKLSLGEVNHFKLSANKSVH